MMEAGQQTKPVANQDSNRLHWGCGRSPARGWINSDIRQASGIDISCDIRHGLPLDDESIDYIVSVHALQEIALPDIVPVLQELRRVLKRGGAVRLVLPDLLKGVAAYQHHDRSYFAVPDQDAESLGAKLVTQLLWYGFSRTLFTPDSIEEQLLRAGFARVDHCPFGETRSAFAEIVSLDNRERESLFVEATK